MAIRPAAIILVNNDLTDNVRDTLVRQLHITEVIDGYVFDDRLVANSDYIMLAKAADQRIMVVRSYLEFNNRELFDVAIFVAHGLAAIEKNNFGPRGKTHSIIDLYWGKLCIF